jgi:hypothetical protein
MNNNALHVPALIEGLERLLRAQLDGYKQLLRCMEAKRAAIRNADLNAITEACRNENATVQRVAEIEKHRLNVIGRLTELLRPTAQTPLCVTEIVECSNLGEVQSKTIMALAAQLRDIVDETKRQSSILRNAAEALSRHMSGIVQSVHSALSRAHVYGQRGRIAPAAHFHSVVDLKS